MIASKAPVSVPREPAAKPSAAQKALRTLGLHRAIDLVLHLPMRYEDETQITSLDQAQDGQVVQIEATVLQSHVQPAPRRQLIALVQDGSETCQLRFFHFYPSTQKALAPGHRVRLRGEIKTGLVGATMIHPTVKSADAPLAATLTPVYPSVAALPQSYLRKAIANALAKIELPELIPPHHLPRALWSLSKSLHYLHNPETGASVTHLQNHQHPAWQRLKAEELLAQQVSQWQARLQRQRRHAPALPSDNARTRAMQKALCAQLGFELTRAQNRVVAEIGQDLACAQPMHRLLQGDVGAGKTVVAALAAVQCIANGFQCALMAPTEILAHQHFEKLVTWLKPLGVEVAWLTGSLKSREKREMIQKAQEGSARLVVGTHAVLSEKVRLPQLGLVIIDEQHRFGVAQRLALRSKAVPVSTAGEAQLEPHLLMMSATPIPRTLAMSYYADLNVSTLDELPPGRTPVVTKVIHEARRDQVIGRIQAQIDAGRQVYWVCPLIEESEAIDLRNASDTLAELQVALHAPSRPVVTTDTVITVGLLHSRLPPIEKKAVMQAFVQGELAVLVSTTVIEVGVDVANASLMVIEHAERFGLSQLHQLRGRVGRGAAASACILMYASGDSGRLGEQAKARLRAMQETQDGFEIARRDLAIRGPGEILGERQSGASLLRFANLDEDQHWLDWAQRLAPLLWRDHPELAQGMIDRWLGTKVAYINA